MSSVLDSALSDLLVGAQNKFGADSCYSAEQHRESVVGIKVPMLWAWFIGGCDVVPLQRAIGCDGRSGSFKSVLMSLEHALWFIQAGGVAIIIDTEEKTSESLVRAMMHRLPPEARRRLVYMRPKSLEQAQQMVMYYKDKATKMLELPEHERFPMYIAWDSLTGSDTEAAQEKVAKEGNAAEKGYSGAASSISKFYKSLVFDKSLLTLGHVQHAKKSMDPNALGDDQLISSGGDEPRFKASYHFRVLSAKDVDSAGFTGKELRMKCVKCGFGPDKRKITIRIQWQYVWVELPEFERAADGSPTGLVAGDTTIPAAEVEGWFQHNQQALSSKEATLLKDHLEVGSGKDASKPKCQPFRFQQMWVNWDWSLGNFLMGLKYEEGLYAKEREELDNVLHFVKSGTEVKCEELFGDDEPRSVEAFGAAVAANAEIADKLRRFLGIVSYQDIRELTAAAKTSADAPKGKKRKKE